MANQSSLGLKRDQVAAADLTRQAQQIQTVARETQNEARRLASAIDTLNGDRDRLYSRVTSLEQGLDSVTGAIARQGSAQAPPACQPPSRKPRKARQPRPWRRLRTTQAAPSTSDKPAASARSEPGPATVSSVAKDPPKDPPGLCQGLGEDRKPEGRRKKAEAAKTETAKSETAAKAETARPKLQRSISPRHPTQRRPRR